MTKKITRIFGKGSTWLVLYLAVAVLVFWGGELTDMSGKTAHPGHFLDTTTETLAEQFAHLSRQRTNSCGGGKDYVARLSSDGKRLQGSCCSPMTLHGYEEQIQGLKKYAGHEIIPPDPYDVPAEWADQMIAHAERTELTPELQAMYDQAVEMSHEGGPCCCKCWHWYAYEGLAKHLLTSERFSAEQIAEVWDLSDACGGDHGHVHV